MIRAPNYTLVAVVGRPCAFSLYFAITMPAGYYPCFTEAEMNTERSNDSSKNARYEQNRNPCPIPKPRLFAA